MVLQDASFPDDAFNQESLATEAAGRADDNDDRPFVIDPSRYARRWTPLGLRRLNQQMVSQQYQILESLSVAIHRPLRTQEKEALTSHLTKSAQVISSQIPVGMTLGAIQAARTMSTFKFPFRKVHDSFNPDKLLFLRGQAARYCWHALRFTSYGALGVFFVGPIISFYGARAHVSAVAQDPRLRAFVDDLARTRAESVNETRARAANSRDIVTSQRPQQTNVSDDPNDMSPTSDRQDLDGEGFGQYPTSGDVVLESVSESTNHKQSPASSWDRIRQQAKPGVAASSSPTAGNTTVQKASSDVDDSYSFSSSDTDKQLATSGAQHDFDALVDRERQGQRHDSSQSDNTRNRRW